MVGDRDMQQLLQISCGIGNWLCPSAARASCCLMTVTEVHQLQHCALATVIAISICSRLQQVHLPDFSKMVFASLTLRCSQLQLHLCM